MLVVLRPRGDLPAARNLAQLQSSAAVGVLLNQRLNRLINGRLIHPENLRDALRVDWFFRDEDQRLSDSLQLSRGDLARALYVVVGFDGFDSFRLEFRCCL